MSESTPLPSKEVTYWQPTADGGMEPVQDGQCFNIGRYVRNEDYEAAERELASADEQLQDQTQRWRTVVEERDRALAVLDRIDREILADKYEYRRWVKAVLSGEPNSPSETAAKPTDSELYGSSELFRHIWVCPMGWIGDKLIYGPGYTLADMKPWLIKLRRLVGFEHPEGAPLEQPEKASERLPLKFANQDELARAREVVSNVVVPPAAPKEEI